MFSRLDEVCSHIVDCKNRTAPIDPDGEYFAVGTPAMRGNVINYSEARRISAETFAVWTERLKPEPGDILFAREAPVGPVVEVPPGGRVAAGQRTTLLRADPTKANPTFLRQYLSAPVTQARVLALAFGSTTPHLRVADIRAFPVQLPPLAEQQAIAEVLGALDDKIAANTKLAETSAELARTLYEDALSEDCNEVTLTDVTTLLTRGVAPKYSEENDTIIVLNQKCIRGQRVGLEPARKTISSKVREDKHLQPNDVLVNSTGQGTLGRVARWTSAVRATADSHISIVRFDPQKVDPTCAGFSVLRMQQVITDMGEGSTGQTELSRAELGKLRISLPSEHHQAVLGERLTELNRLETELLAESTHLAATRDALLPQLMSGKLRVKDIEHTMGEMV